jgi:hypothetical protein
MTPAATKEQPPLARLKNLFHHPFHPSTKARRRGMIGLADAVVALSTAGLFVFAAVQIYLQRREQNLRTKLELFERRYAVFQQVRDLINSAFRGADAIMDEMSIFNRNISSFHFVIDDPALWKHIIEIRNRALEVHETYAYLNDPSQRRSEHNQKHHDNLQWLGEQNEALIERFRPWLNLPSPSSMTRWRSVLVRSAIVLSIGWSAAAGGFAYLTAPPSDTFRVALSSEPRNLLRETDQERSAQDIIREAIRMKDRTMQQQAAAKTLKEFAILNGLIWLVPIIGIWSLVWIFAPPSKER